MIRPSWREQNSRSRLVRRQVRLDLVRVRRAARLREVVNRLVRSQAHREAGIAELQVEIDQQRRVPGVGETDDEVAGSNGLAASALRAEDADHRRDGDAARYRRALLPRDRFVEREENAVGRL